MPMSTPPAGKTTHGSELIGFVGTRSRRAPSISATGNVEDPTSGCDLGKLDQMVADLLPRSFKGLPPDAPPGCDEIPALTLCGFILLWVKWCCHGSFFC